MSVYKNEKPNYLNNTFESITFEQSKNAAEIIIVKDGPLTNELDMIISKWESILCDQLKIVEMKHNVGLGEALNHGLQYCTNDWVFRMDTDDICLPDRFEKQIQFIKNNPDISLLGSSTEEFDENMENSFGYRTNPTEHNAIVNYAKKKKPL